MDCSEWNLNRFPEKRNYFHQIILYSSPYFSLSAAVGVEGGVQEGGGGACHRGTLIPPPFFFRVDILLGMEMGAVLGVVPGRWVGLDSCRLLLVLFRGTGGIFPLAAEATGCSLGSTLSLSC